MDTLIVNCMEYILENQLNSYRTFRRYVESYASGCRTVVALIRRRAALSPAAVAVVDKTSALSYEELDRQSDALAIHLRQNGVGAGKYVGIMLPRTKEYIVAILATLKAGGTYVPLDAACPRIRLNTIVTQSSMSCLIIRGGKIPTWDAQPVQSVIDMEDMSYASPGCACAPDYSEEVGAACLMFTSGTTGEPKGVIISHRYIKSLALYGSRLFQLTERDRVMLHPSFGVIASFGNIYPALISGSSVHIISDDLRHDIMALRRYIVHAGISGGVLYTAIGSQLLDRGLTGMRWMMMGGEPLVSPSIPAGMSVYICLGCTEGLFIAHSQIGAGEHKGVMALTTPAACNVTLLVDAAGNPVKQGEIGEIAITGDVVADGYVDDRQATGAKFGSSPLIAGRTLYRTGDLGRINDRGMFEYCGRADRQIKVSGYRIEPAEVEAAILGFGGGIVGTIVAAVNIGNTRQLCAWYASERPIAASSIKDHVSRLLPAYMVPKYYVHTPSLLTGNGDKIDVASLPLPEIASDEIVPPRDMAEEKVLAMVKRVLGCDQIGVTTDLVTVGLTSLQAMYIATCMEEELQLTLHTWQMLGKRSIRQWLAEARHTGHVVHTYPARRFYPLLAGQWRIYHEMLDDPYNAKNGTFRLIFMSAMTVSRLAAAVERVIEAHQSLGVRIVLHKGVPMMERSDSAKPDVEVYEVAEDWDSHECARHLKPFFISEESNPLVRIVVIGKPSGAYLLIHCAHIIYDGASLQLFLDDLIAALQGKALQPEPVTLFDVSLQEAAYAGTAQGVRDQEYYGQLCSGCTAITELQPGKDLSGSVGFSYDTGLVDAYCRSKAVTASSFWTTTMLRALHRVTGIGDLAVCTFSSRRSAAEWRRTSGMLLRLLPIVSHSRDQEPDAAMRELQDQLTATLQHEQYPFCKIQYTQNLPFSFLYIYQEGLARLHYPEDWHEVSVAVPHDETRICCVQVFPYATGTKVCIEYNGTSYSRSGAQLLADKWQSVVCEIINKHLKTTENYGTQEN